MAINPCTPGALQRVFEADIPTPDSFPNPVLQVLQVKSLAAQPGAPERLVLFVFDVIYGLC